MSPAASSPHSSPKAYLALALVLSIFAIAPLFYPGYILTHSGFIPIWNVADLRTNPGWNWLPHLATHFDPLRSDGLLPYYLARVLPGEPETAIKIILGLGWLLGSAGMYLWLNRWLGNPAALTAALVYTYLPYRLAAVYARGAWGEALFWGLLPWAILICRQPTKTAQQARESGPPSITGASIALGRFTSISCIWLMLGLSQLGLTLWAFLLAMLLLLTFQGRRTLRPGIASFLGVVLAAVIFFALAAGPASPPLFSDHFLYPFQLFSAFWGFGPSRAGWDDGLSLQLGLAAIGLTILSVFSWQRYPLRDTSETPTEPLEARGAYASRKRLREAETTIQSAYAKQKRYESGSLPISRADRRLTFLVAAVLLGILLQFGFTNFLWQTPLGPTGYILADTLTYPWQLTGLVGLCLAVLAGAALWLDAQLTRLPLLGSIIIFVVLTSYPYLEPHFIQLDPEIRNGPQAELGAAQLGLLSHSFEVTINDNTAGLEHRSTAKIPLSAYGPLQANNILHLQVTWQPFQPFSEDWKIFVHLVASNGQTLAQFDGQPLDGAYPTSRWIPGELIEDSYPLSFPANAPPGPYRVFLGLYKEATGERLPIPNDSEGRVILNVE